MRSKFSYSETELEQNKVLEKQIKDLSKLKKEMECDEEKLAKDIETSQVFVEKSLINTKTAESVDCRINKKKKSSGLSLTWEDEVENAKNESNLTVYLEDIFTDQEIESNNQYIKKLKKEFKNFSKLDQWDYGVAGISGTLAALIDYFLVTRVSPNPVNLTAGRLKSGIEKLWDQILTPEVVGQLEKRYSVPFDISTNTSRIAQEVFGLSPKSHRFQSLGHDPILGFIFGVKDILNGELTAIDGTGRLIIQKVTKTQHVRVTEAIITEFGHLLSDVNAQSKTGLKLSIPAPLTPLIQLIQVGNVSYNGKDFTIGDVIKQMYIDGYNFNQFIGMSIPVVLIHIIVHLYSAIRILFSKNYSKSQLKVDKILLLSNALLSSENIGKVVITKSPFAVNYVSWLITAEKSLSVLKQIMIDQGIDETVYIQRILDKEFDKTYEIIDKAWKSSIGESEYITLT